MAKRGECRNRAIIESMSTFEEFLEAWPPYAEVFHQLEAEDRKLAFSASAVHAVNGDDIARVRARPFFNFLKHFVQA